MLADPGIPAGVAVAGSALPHEVIGAVAALVGLLVLPGWAWVAVLAHRTAWAPDRLERLGYALTLSVAILALGGVALSKASVPLTATSWVVLVAGVTVPPLVARWVPAGRPRRSSPARPTARRPTLATTVACTAAGLLGSGALVLAVVVSLRSDGQRRETLTELGARWTVDGDGVRSLAADVHNLEGRSVTYSLRFAMPTGEVRSERRVPSGGWWTPRVRIAAEQARTTPTTVTLFRDGHPAAYRRVQVAADPSLPAPCERGPRRAESARCPRTLDAIPGGVLRLPDLEVRVIARRTPATGLELDLRLHNPTGRSVHVTDRGPFALDVAGGDPIDGRATGPRTLEAGATADYQLTFAGVSAPRTGSGRAPTLVLPPGLGRS